MLLESEELRLSQPTNASAALEWFARAAEHSNHSEALYMLGWAHYSGILYHTIL